MSDEQVQAYLDHHHPGWTINCDGYLVPEGGFMGIALMGNLRTPEVIDATVAMSRMTTKTVLAEMEADNGTA